MIRRLVFLVPLGAALGFHGLAAAMPAFVEESYAQRVYPRIAAVLTAANTPLPFALADLLAAVGLALAIVLLVRWARTLRHNRKRAFGVIARAMLIAAGVGYLSFLLLWALNYRRQPLAASIGLDTQPAPVSELAFLAAELTADANALRETRKEESGLFRLEAGFDGALQRASAAVAAPFPAGARPKGSLFSPLLARLGISGIFIPFTGEPLVDTLVPESEVPFGACHELAHFQGWAREDEASFVAYTACRAHADPDFRYSGALVASLHACAALGARDREATQRVIAARSPGVARDVAAIAAWRQRYEGALSRIGDRMNDTYLRSQGDPRGLHSYGRMVDLLLAARRAGRLARPETVAP